MNNGYEDGVGPTLVSYSLTREAYDYLMRIVSLGAFEGPIGDMKINADLEPVLSALHEVLAGGRVAVTVEQRGSPDIKRELNERLARSTHDANEINRRSGFYVTLAG